MTDNISKIQALVKLLADPSEEIYFQVYNELLSLGEEALPALEEAWEYATDDEYLGRLKSLTQLIRFNKLSVEFEDWMNSEEQDLLDLMYLIACIGNPTLNKSEIIKAIAEIKLDIWLELNDNMTILEQTKVINKIFYEKHGFHADDVNPYDLSNFFIDQVLDHKRGNDTTLGVLYLYFVQSQKMSFKGVNLLPNFILAYTSDIEQTSMDDVLFYLNPYRNGVIFSLSNLLEYFKAYGVIINTKDITPCTTMDIAKRWLWFLQQAYTRMGDEQRSDQMNKLIDIFARN